MNDSARGRGLRTGIQTVIGVLVTFIVGLVMVVWNVPGVPVAVIDYVGKNLVQVLLLVGVPAGVTSYLWNLARKDVPNK